MNQSNSFCFINNGRDEWNMKNEIHYHFVGNVFSGDDLDEIRSLKWNEGTIACTRHGWVWPLYCQLKMRENSVSFSYELQEGAVNIIHGQVARRQLKASDVSRYFIIGVRADFRPFPYGQFEIVQNKKTCGGRRIYLPHYPQPGLISRDPSRGHMVSNICYTGRLNNLADIDLLKQELDRVGCALVLKEYGHWHELLDVDVLIGVRSFSKKPYNDKPASKLINAWLAGIPFIGGFDSAYSQVGTPEKDYLRVLTMTDLVNAVVTLRDDGELYNSMVFKGYQSAKEYTVEKITDRWIEFLSRDVEPAFNRWNQKGKLLKTSAVVRAIGFFCEKKIRHLRGMLK